MGRSLGPNHARKAARRRVSDALRGLSALTVDGLPPFPVQLSARFGWLQIGSKQTGRPARWTAGRELRRPRVAAPMQTAPTRRPDQNWPSAN